MDPGTGGQASRSPPRCSTPPPGDAIGDFRGRAPVTSLSRPIGAGRRLATVRLPLEYLQFAGHRLGVTVNDLLLAAVTGGLRNLLARRGDELSGLVLRASVPVGTRAAGQPVD